MKFTEHLSAHITPEWRKQYINYEHLKSTLNSAVEQAPSAELIEPDILTRYFAKFDERFFSECDKELTKINTFYSEKLAEATRKCAGLKSDLNEAQEAELPSKKSSSIKNNLLRKRNVPPKKIQELKLAFSEFYLSLILLQNYQNLNFTGFRKILKKHDKLLNVDVGAKWRVDHVESSHFHTNKDIDRLIRETENTVTQDLESGDRQKAMKRLRVPPLGEQQIPWTTFKVGWFSGSFAVLIVAVIISAIFHKRRDDWRIVCRLYRAPFLIIEFLFLWGINIYGWRSSGVNHVLIFEMDPRNHLSEQHIIEMAAIFGVIWSISVLFFLYSTELNIPAYINPLVLVILMLIFLLNPTTTMRHEARFWAIGILTRVVTAPFRYVTFADFWVADQLNSMVTLFTDLHYFICFYFTNSIWSAGEDINYCIEQKKHIVFRAAMACLPAWFRFAQCIRRYRDTKEGFPHLANAAKYATTFFVVIFTACNSAYSGFSLTKIANKSVNKLILDGSISDSPFFYLWITALLISSCYAYTWDIKLDWGLFDAKAGDNKFLREEIVYSSTWFYYFAIIEDFILRFAWAFSMSLTELGYVHADLMITILAPLEVFRRFIWNFFRLENEHLNNCGKFRAVRDISVAPLDTSDQMLIVRMMDEEDGVTNRRKKKSGGKKKDETRLIVEGESTDDMDI